MTGKTTSRILPRQGYAFGLLMFCCALMVAVPLARAQDAPDTEDLRQAHHEIDKAQSAVAPSGGPLVDLDGVGMRFLSIVHDGQLIWDLSRIPDRENTNLEFPYIIRFKERWYCSFREGDRHGNDPSGRARVITSVDGATWETAVLLEWQGGDIRDPRLSVTPDGQLMINASIYFIGEPKPDPAPWEQPGKRQSVTWLSEDGVTWSEAQACPTGFDTWRWDVAWHNGFGYSAGYAGKDIQGTLYRTQDGRTWEPLVENFFPDGRGTEAALGFSPDGTACCLLRPRGAGYGMFGTALPPYLDWHWQSMRIDAANNGELETGEEFGRRTASIVGGQKLLLLEDGRMIAITAKGGVDLFWVEPQKALFTRFARLSDCKTYPGLVEHNGELWLTNAQRMEQGRGIKSGIYLLRLKVPPRETLANLKEMAAQSLAVDIDGFGQLYQAELREALETIPAGMEADSADAEKHWSVRAGLRKAIGDLQEALALRTKLEQAITGAEAYGREAVAGFGEFYQAQVHSQIPSLRLVLADQQAGISDARTALAVFDDARAGWEQARIMRARADSALERVAPLLHASFSGFARLYQGGLQRCDDALRELLQSPSALTEALQAAVENLLDADDAWQGIDVDVPVTVLEMPAAPGSMILADDADWRKGLLVNVVVDNHALIPATASFLAFGEKARTSVKLGNPPAVSALKDAFTVMAWGLPANAEAYRTLIDKGGRDAGFSIRHGRTRGSANRVSVRMYLENEPHPHEPYQVGFKPPDPVAFNDRWHHYACTYDSKQLVLFVDGQAVNALSKESNLDLTEGDLCIGTFANGGEPWQGLISDVTIWSQALTPKQLARQARRKLRGDAPGLVGNWPLNDGAGDVALDHSAQGNNGQITGGAWRKLPMRYGYRLSNPMQCDPAGLESCTITWEAQLPDDPGRADIVMTYGWTASPDALPAAWHPAAPGGDLLEHAGVGAQYLWLKQELLTHDPAAPPRLRRMQITLARENDAASVSSITKQE